MPGTEGILHIFALQEGKELLSLRRKGMAVQKQNALSIGQRLALPADGKGGRLIGGEQRSFALSC